MRVFFHQTIIALLGFIISQSVYAELIYGFNKVSVTEKFTTSVEFDQSDLKNYKPKDNLKLRVKDNDKVIREDAILNKNGVWVWDKILPFSGDLTFSILKDGKTISTDFFADTKNSLNFSANSDPTIRPTRGAHYLPSTPSEKNSEKKRLAIEIPKDLEKCKDRVLVLVYNKENNVLLWQYFGELKKDLTTEPIDLSKEVQRIIVTDEGSCVK